MSHCLVIKVLSFLSLRQLVYFITSFFVCQELFSSFFKLFRCSFKQFALSLTACLLYHTQKGLSTSFLTFFKVFQVVSSKESFLCDSQINLPLSSASVNCFFYKFLTLIFCSIAIYLLPSKIKLLTINEQISNFAQYNSEYTDIKEMRYFI